MWSMAARLVCCLLVADAYSHSSRHTAILHRPERRCSVRARGGGRGGGDRGVPRLYRTRAWVRRTATQSSEATSIPVATGRDLR